MSGSVLERRLTKRDDSLLEMCVSFRGSCLRNAFPSKRSLF